MQQPALAVLEHHHDAFFRVSHQRHQLQCLASWKGSSEPKKLNKLPHLYISPLLTVQKHLFAGTGIKDFLSSLRCRKDLHLWCVFELRDSLLCRGVELCVRQRQIWCVAGRQGVFDKGLSDDENEPKRGFGNMREVESRPAWTYG